MDKPCLRPQCWCKDETLPQVGSLWILRREHDTRRYRALHYHEIQYVYRILTNKKHTQLHLQMVDTSTPSFEVYPSTDVYTFYNHLHPQGHLESIEKFYKWHEPYIKDEI